MSNTAKPLVTFALFAYNQEQFIRAAVEGAFSQTYEPLEIILSDDCSTDRTFEIMKEMSANYQGPHTVIVRRSSVNRGLGLHLEDVAFLVRSQYMVLAAGDDISLPHRTTALVSIMVKNGAKFAASNYNKMTEDGFITKFNIKNDYSENYIWKILDYDCSYFAGGAFAAYDINFFRSALSAAKNTIQTGKLFNEDILIAAYAVAVNEKPVEYELDGLVHYRINSSSLSNFSEKGISLKSEIAIIQREKFYSSSRLAILSAIIEISENYPNIIPKMNFHKIEVDKRLAIIQLAASDENFLVRFRSLFMVKSLIEFRIFLARIFGYKTLALMRFIKRKLLSL